MLGDILENCLWFHLPEEFFAYLMNTQENKVVLTFPKLCNLSRVLQKKCSSEVKLYYIIYLSTNTATPEIMCRYPVCFRPSVSAVIVKNSTGG